METLIEEKLKMTVGEQMYQLVEELYPICRSITGDGVRETLRKLKSRIPLEEYEIPSGFKAFDWEVPKEWNILDAWIKDSSGKKIVDFADSNLHVVSYSMPVHRHLSLPELKEHLYTLAEYPNWIPYRTSYYKEDWGFCMAHKQFLNLKDDLYEVYIDSSLKAGHLTFAEYYLQGELSDEVMISTHICHPSLCNDNLSGISVVTFLAKWLQEKKLRYSYRFLFIPGTIGAITWLAINESKTKYIKHGLIAALLGIDRDFIYKKSRRGNAEIDLLVEEALARSGYTCQILNYTPYGYDERQFCSPGFNLPVGSLSRAGYGNFPEYHTSADDLDFVKPAALENSLTMFKKIISMLEANKKYVNINPKCEPNLGRRGLYNLVGGERNSRATDMQMVLLWVLNLSDGSHSLLDICRQSNMPFELVLDAAEKLVECKLLVRV
jgi:aminopeptidase-like protein